ncbi:MAG TPA: tetratricopeptide repeat protein, partial [Bacteroidales bacterium]|nr:tetratricopeptide repeat protein [Bacteroidales bacterium]
ISAIDELTSLIMKDSGDALLFQQRALLYLEEKQHSPAMRDMITAIQLDPDNASYMLTLSDIYLSMGLLENCVESLEKALELDPGNAESMLKLAEINLILKKYKEALQYADKAIEQDRINPLPFFIKGYTYAEAGDTVSAIKNYLEAIDKDQNYYDAYIQLGFIYSTAGNRLAVDYFNNALNINPESIEALYALGLFYQEAEDAANAIATYNKILVIDPTYVFAYYNLGYVHLVLLNEYRTAIDYFRQVVELKPDYFEAVYNMGYCYELLEDYTNARERYTRTLEIEVNYARAIEGLNRIYGK